MNRTKKANARDLADWLGVGLVTYRSLFDDEYDYRIESNYDCFVFVLMFSGSTNAPSSK